MEHAIIRDGIVENICLWDGVTPWQPPAGTSVVALNGRMAGIGWTYDGQTFTPPAE